MVFDGARRSATRTAIPSASGAGPARCSRCSGSSTHGPVAFVGEGQSDRYGALYADVVYAKDALVPICERDGVPYRPWTTFDDVRATSRALAELPGPVAPERCPGWRPA
ncbi:MAG: hypothetical protein KatS3mg014_1422 [Actinomycetota bacterium]|nr:MAG: hypothetical protein KatS3mg014_1422 [Actinomycetota bacterium]